MYIPINIINTSKVERGTSDEIDLDYIIVKLDMANDVDVNNSNDWSTILQTVVSGGARKIIVDMENLFYIDSSGIGNLIYIAKIIRANKGDIAFINVPEKIDELFALVHLQRFIRIYSSEKEAVNYLRAYI